MNRLFPVLIILGIMLWGFLMWDRARPDAAVQEFAAQADNANTADRCAKYRTVVTDDAGDEIGFFLGYKDRLRQLLDWCF